MGGALVWVDFKTTWLSRRLHRIATAQVTAGLAVVVVHSPGAFVTTLAGACATLGVFQLVWWFSGSFGFGDVGFGLLAGVTADSMGLQVWTTALLTGTLIEANWVIAYALRGRASEPLPCGPPLRLGPVVAAALTGDG